MRQHGAGRRYIAGAGLLIKLSYDSGAVMTGAASLGRL